MDGEEALGSNFSTVYIVDDDGEVRDSLYALLDSYGFRVEKYANGVEFTARYRTDMQGCLLLDLHMPGISGMEVLRYLRQDVRTRLPVVIMTGGADKSAEEHVFAAGASAYVEKPFDSEAMMDLVKMLMCDRPLTIPA
jgi:FixJ family two-component response regulator